MSQCCKSSVYLDSRQKIRNIIKHSKASVLTERCNTHYSDHKFGIQLHSTCAQNVYNKSRIHLHTDNTSLMCILYVQNCRFLSIMEQHDDKENPPCPCSYVQIPSQAAIGGRGNSLMVSFSVYQAGSPGFEPGTICLFH